MSDRLPIDRKTFKQLTDCARDELFKGHLSTSLDILNHILLSSKQTSETIRLVEQREAVDSDYQRLLYYMGVGMVDPDRGDVYLELKQRTFGVLQDLRREYYVTNQQNIYSQVASHWDSVLMLQVIHDYSKHNYHAQDVLFNLIWTSPQLHSGEEHELRTLLHTADEQLRTHLLNALILSLLHSFDAAKLQLLVESCTDSQGQERACAITGIIFSLLLYPKELQLFPHLEEDIIQLVKSDGFKRDVQCVQRYLWLYRETERLQQKMEKDIIPTLIKYSRERRRMGFDEMDIDPDIDEDMPNMPKETQRKLVNGLQDIMRMVGEGMDVNIHTFVGLKGYPFFQNVAHWLAPYDPHRPEIHDFASISILPLCDADKYSIAFLWKSLPVGQQEIMRRTIEAHSEVLEIESKEKMDEYQNVIQCFYRLIRRSPWRMLWPNIFSPEMLLIRNGLMRESLKQCDSYLHDIGMLLFQHAQYQAAEEHLQLYAELIGMNAGLLLRLGICAEKQGKYQRASNRFQQSLLLKQSPEALRHLQICFARLERWEEQLECLVRLEQIDSTNEKISSEKGLCLIQLGRWEEAQNCFYKMELNGQKPVPSSRAIAWCALHLKDYAEAQKRYMKLIDDNLANWEDYLNAGHASWLLGDVREAIAYYEEYVKLYPTQYPEVTDKMAPFCQDESLLVACGISKDDFSLMHDLISKK